MTFTFILVPEILGNLLKMGAQEKYLILVLAQTCPFLEGIWGGSSTTLQNWTALIYNTSYVFGSLHAVCLRLLRKALATNASCWICKLSDIPRSGEKIMLPQESEICHLPRVRNRKERWGQAFYGLYFNPSSNSPD